MKEKRIIAALALAASLAGFPLSGAPDTGDIRTIRLVQDDGQIRIVSKLYDLRYLKATDVRPFIEAAVKLQSREKTGNHRLHGRRFHSLCG